ncbi:kiSS-1 receptor-like [Lytechinus variegatus]|uniref:kiSS-1 receptor-like n=1 Tax=Lytechinus variegatus TaxID=7654 RepID=UPI001BB114D7|nr:kiSS-1 receptor-like [Lytechinus variegatus]
MDYDESSFDNYTGNGTAYYDVPTNVLSVFVLALFVVVGIFGNSMVIYIIIKHRDMRTVTNYFVLNLAVTDIAMLIICAVPTGIVYSISMVDWPLGDFMCRLTGYTMNVSPCLFRAVYHHETCMYR